MHFLAIFLRLCVVMLITNIHVKDHFNWLSCFSPRVMWICPSFRPEFMAAAAWKPQLYVLLDFLKLKTLGQVLVLFSKKVDQRVFPGKIWRNPKFEFWKLILDTYSPLHGLKFTSCYFHYRVLTVNTSHSGTARKWLRMIQIQRKKDASFSPSSVHSHMRENSKTKKAEHVQ